MAVNSALAPSHFSPGGLLDGGKYRIIRQLGAGGMGAVFEAENTLTRKRVAIKCLHAGRAAHPDARARLLREAEAASRIRHPHVVDVYDVGRDADSVFLVMEYLEGEALSQLLARGGTAIHALIALLLPAMRAVAEAHRLGVVHRDIKPDNIFLAREADARGPVPKVLDFGISKLSAHDGDQASLTLSGSCWIQCEWDSQAPCMPGTVCAQLGTGLTCFVQPAACPNDRLNDHVCDETTRACAPGTDANDCAP